MIILDIFAYLLSIIISLLFYSIPFKVAIINMNWVLIAGGGFFFILSIYNYGGYKDFIEFSQLNQISALLKASVLVVVITIVYLFIFSINISEFLTISSRVVFVISLLVIPIALRQLFGPIFVKKDYRENMLIYGAGEIGSTFSKTMKNTKFFRFNLVGFIDDKVTVDSIINGVNVLGVTDDLDSICKNKHINRIIIAIRHISEEKLVLLENKASALDIRINCLPSVESFLGNPGKLKEFSGIPLISRRVQRQSMFYLLGKRVLDIIAAAIGLIISSPLWVVIPIIIKRDSPGPAIFEQERVGLNGKLFNMYKFRSMKEDAPKYAHCPINKDDPRVTTVGRWLRKTSLDELPQLINIFKGDMSLVGPRPEMLFIANEYNLVEKKRLLVKPGLTGLWQVSPYRNSEISHNLEYDFYYIENQSFMLDFVILIMTAFFIVRGITH